MRFDGKVAVITGAASGIGAATALEFAKRGGSVAVVDVDGDGAARVVEEIRRSGGKALSLTADLTRLEQIDAAFEQTLQAWGRIDLLHNNAFGLPPELRGRRIARIEQVDPAVWETTLQVGLTAVLRATQRALPIMRQQRAGAIVNTSSLAAFYGDHGSVAYNTVKAGLINFTRVTAVENAADNIRANCICPGAVDTPLLQRGLRDRGLSAEQAFREVVPLRRAGQATEVANAVLFLASDLATYITGAVLVIDGGVSAAAGLVMHGPH